MEEICYCTYKGKEEPQNIDIVSLRIVKDTSIPYYKDIISSPADAYSLFRKLIGDYDRELFIVCCLNTINNPTLLSTVSIGNLSSATVHPREVFKLAIVSNSASVIVAHNHPSGGLEPSKDDISTTDRLHNAGKIIGIKLLDHLIVTSDSYVSFRERDILM